LGVDQSLVRLVSPDDLEIGCERGEERRIGNRREAGGIMGGNLAFDLGRVRERLVPARLKFCGR